MKRINDYPEGTKFILSGIEDFQDLYFIGIKGKIAQRLFPETLEEECLIIIEDKPLVLNSEYFDYFKIVSIV